MTIVRVLLRIAVVLAYCFLGVSLLMLMGSSFGAAFLTTFTVENGLDEAIYVTPVGTVGPIGARFPLPVCHDFVISIPSAVRGRYKLQPTETVTITYDMDDINFSEIVVENETGTMGQLIVNATPLIGQYTAPSVDHFLLQSNSLVPVPTAVANAANLARRRTNKPLIIVLLIVMPWPSVLMLSWLNKKSRQSISWPSRRSVMK